MNEKYSILEKNNIPKNALKFIFTITFGFAFLGKDNTDTIVRISSISIIISYSLIIIAKYKLLNSLKTKGDNNK